VHQYQLDFIYLYWLVLIHQLLVTVSGCSKPSSSNITIPSFRDKNSDQKLQRIMNTVFSLIPCHLNYEY